jgi:hypothetical protein
LVNVNAGSLVGLGGDGKAVLEVEVASGFVRVGALVAEAEGVLVLADVLALAVASDAVAARRLFGWYILESRSCSGSPDLFDIPVPDLRVDDEIVKGAVVDDGVVEQVVCFEFIGMQVRLLTWKTGAFSRRPFGIASRLPWPQTSKRKSLRTFSWPGHAFINGHSSGLVSLVLSVQATRSWDSSSSTISLWKGLGGLDWSGSVCGGVEQLKQ